jgi:hypothetical protein
VAVGIKVTDRVQAPPAAMVAPQLWLTAKSPEAATEVRLKAAVPEFVSVTVRAALVVPVVCDPKVRAEGDSAAAGAVATPVPESATV